MENFEEILSYQLTHESLRTKRVKHTKGLNGRQEMIKLRAEINILETKKMTPRINETELVH